MPIGTCTKNNSRDNGDWVHFIKKNKRKRTRSYGIQHIRHLISVQKEWNDRVFRNEEISASKLLDISSVKRGNRVQRPSGSGFST